jgi:hypothetical protein
VWLIIGLIEAKDPEYTVSMIACEYYYRAGLPDRPVKEHNDSASMSAQQLMIQPQIQYSS